MVNNTNDIVQPDNFPRLNVQTVHILKTGELIYGREDYEKVKERFSWVDKNYIVSEVLRLRNLTDTDKQTYIAIYEDGNRIKTFLNLGYDFHPSDFTMSHE